MRPNSLRYLLLRRLLWPLIPVLLSGAMLSYVLAKRAAVNAYDLGILDDAHDLAEQIHWQLGEPQLALPLAATQMLSKNNEDRVIYAVWDKHGRLIDGDANLQAAAQSPYQTDYLYQDLQLDKKNYRAIVLRSTIASTVIDNAIEPTKTNVVATPNADSTVYIAVAQSTLNRSHLLHEIFFSMLLLGGGSVFVSSSVVLSGVRRGLTPVDILRDEIARRSPNDLHALTETDTPIELRPIVHGINELLRKLAAAFASHRRFIADAAHQLRTPLAALGSQIEVSLAQPPTDIKIMLAQLLATTQRTSHLANQLLSLARLEHTEHSVSQTENVDIGTIVRHAAADFVIPAERKHIELDFALQRCVVRGSSLMLRELVANLLDNAVRYVPTYGSVKVLLQHTDAGIELAIHDSGAGVPPAELNKLGIPFHRATSAAPEGCGLGLAIVREIARLHNASVFFENGANGSGFCVRIQFPSSAEILS